MNDRCCLLADGFKKLLQIITAQRHSWETSGRRELGSVGKDRTESGRIPRRASGREDKTNDDKGQTWKDLSVTKRIISAHIKDKMGILNILGDGKVTRLGATQAIS